MGAPVQPNGEVPVLLRRILNPIGLKAPPENLLQGPLGPGKPGGSGQGFMDPWGFPHIGVGHRIGGKGVCIW